MHHAISAFVSRAQRRFLWQKHTKPQQEGEVNLLGQLEEKKLIVADLTEKFKN